MSCDSTNGNFLDFASGFTRTQSWEAATPAGSNSCSCGAGLVRAQVLTTDGVKQRCVNCPGGTTAAPATCTVNAPEPFTNSEADLQAVLASTSLTMSQPYRVSFPDAITSGTGARVQYDGVT